MPYSATMPYFALSCGARSCGIVTIFMRPRPAERGDGTNGNGVVSTWEL